MKSNHRLRVREILFAVLLAASAAPGFAVARGCDERCLSGLMQRYLQQMSRHDPAKLPLAASLNARENSQPTALGEGSWKSVNGVLPGLLFADATTGEVIYAGGARHAERIGSLFVRLKTVDGKITESELWTRGGEPTAQGAEAGRDMSGLTEPDILYDAPVPVERRSSRAQLVQIVRGYLEGISKHDGSIPHFSYRCDRYNAGFKWTNNPDNPESRGGGTCASSFTNLTGAPVVNVRIPVIDVPRGVVAALFIIPHPERKTPGATYVAEVFKIVDGKVRSIEEFGGAGGYPPDSGFPDP
jgi:hypothetical protein